MMVVNTTETSFVKSAVVLIMSEFLQGMIGGAILGVILGVVIGVGFMAKVALRQHLEMREAIRRIK